MFVLRFGADAGKWREDIPNISYLMFIQSISIFLDRFIKRIQTNKQSDCTKWNQASVNVYEKII